MTAYGRVGWLNTATVRRARPDEADTLTILALRSKAHWGYDQEFIDACRTELTLTPGFVVKTPVRVFVANCRLLGFYSLVRWNSDVELGHFFVDPAVLRQGVGTRLWEDAVEQATSRGYQRLYVQSDPNAESFYLRLGAERIGDVPSAVRAGRMLPLLMFELAEER